MQHERRLMESEMHCSARIRSHGNVSPYMLFTAVCEKWMHENMSARVSECRSKCELCSKRTAEKTEENKWTVGGISNLAFNSVGLETRHIASPLDIKLVQVHTSNLKCEEIKKIIYTQFVSLWWCDDKHPLLWNKTKEQESYWLPMGPTSNCTALVK